MALKRLLLGISALSVICVNVAIAQFQPTTANQDGIIIMDGIGRFFSAPLDENNVGQLLFKELEDTSQRFGFIAPVAKDLELVAHPDGAPRGAYVVDVYGGQFSLNLISSPGVTITSPIEEIPTMTELGVQNPNFSVPPYFGFEVVEDLEIAPDWRDITHGFKGYFILDQDGVVHPLGETNLPSFIYYPFGTDVNNADPADAGIYQTLFPESIDVTGSTITPENLLQRNTALDFPVNWSLATNQNINSVTPIFTYFGPGSDVARDLEISVAYTQLTMPSSIADDLAAGIDISENFVMPTSPSIPLITKTIAMTNGYYILDGAGAVHSSRLPLDFDVNNDGRVLLDDMLTMEGEMNSAFGEPVNFAPLAPPWENDREDLPYFGLGSDFAVDVEITPGGKGFYLLDAFGGIFAVGDAHFTFPPKMVDGVPVRSNSTTPYFGFPIARDLNVVANDANASLGLDENTSSVGILVLDGFGTVHQAGIAETFDVSEKGNKGMPVESFTPYFAAVETTPLWLSKEAPIEMFDVGLENYALSVAPNFRITTPPFPLPSASFANITAAFSTITAPAGP